MKERDLSSYSKKAAYHVMIFAAGFVFVLLVIGGIQAVFLHYNNLQEPVDIFTEMLMKCTNLECRNSALEVLAQDNRMQNVRDFLATRHMVALASFTIAFSLCVLGAVLVFDRVKNEDEIKREVAEGLSAGLSQGWIQTEGEARDLSVELGTVFKVSANSQFPGYLMCILGSLLAAFTLWQFMGVTNKTLIKDGPVYVTDDNLARDFIYGPSGLASAAAVERRREEATKRLNDYIRQINSYSLGLMWQEKTGTYQTSNVGSFGQEDKPEPNQAAE